MVRARFPLSRRAMNRGIIASSRFDATSPTSTRDANARVFVRTSRPSVSPSRHIQHTSSTSSPKNEHARAVVSRIIIIDRVNARAGRGLFLSHEPSRVPPPSCAHATIHSNACVMNPPRRIDRRRRRRRRRRSFASRVPSPLPSSARDVDGGGSIIVPARRRTRPPMTRASE